MQVAIKRIDPTLPLPEYHTTGSVAFDIASRIDMEISPQTIARIPTNLIIQVPDGFMLAVVPRSSTPAKKGLLIPHGMGVIDQDFCGKDDEILFQVYNYTNQPVTVSRGERLAQGIFLPVQKITWTEVDHIDQPIRGGFGSSG